MALVNKMISCHLQCKQCQSVIQRSYFLHMILYPRGLMNSCQEFRLEEPVSECALLNAMSWDSEWYLHA